MAVTLSPARAPARTRSATMVAGCLRRWHLLSLDAPTVAVVWAAAIARTQRAVLPVAELAALFVAVWLLYVADRLLDGRGDSRGKDLQRRHLFHRAHRRGFVFVAMVAVICLIPLTLMVDRSDLRLDVALAAGLAGWFLIIHWFTSARRLPKEVVAGIFFAAAATIPAYTRHATRGLLPVGILFAAVCTLNGLLITRWESDASGLRFAERKGFAAGVCVLGLGSIAAFPAQAGPLLAIGLSSGLLLLLDRYYRRIEPTTLRAAADLVLLTPLLVWPLLR